ncbi:DUF4142 domain-containing protein [Sediminibacterium soli]|uniref:DUF4142 domain-containing protein n=1 Tax=Sediminibacterium soli TaxID=2698829 RepID=UPI00137B3C53|nr:DUF4142 domain-containing protein [Sediminibacterium soli]NCI46758.1 DUF4142 domain-containing protein [Sediminibacterium soli]
MKRVQMLGCSLVLLLGLACNSTSSDEVKEAKQDNARKLDSQQRTDGNGVNPIPEKGDMNFLVNVYSMSLFDQRLSRMVAEKKGHIRLQRFASMLTKDHQALDKQVTGLAAAKQVTLPADISNRQQREIDRLQRTAGDAFNRSCVDVLYDVHRRMIRDFENQAKNAGDAVIKTFAAGALPGLYSHLDSLGSLRKQFPPLKDSTYIPVLQ